MPLQSVKLRNRHRLFYGLSHGWHWLFSTKGLITLCAVFTLWFFLNRGSEAIYITLEWTDETYQVSEDFLGVAIDAAMMTDGEWWENSDSPPRPLNFENEQLRKWARLLQPDWVRLGGTEADKIWLASSTDSMPSSNSNPSIVSKATFSAFIEFTVAIDAKPFITASAGPHVRVNNNWQPEQFERLLSWLPEGFNGALELGNEPGAYWLIFGRRHQIPFDQLADEYKNAQGFANAQGIQLAGPANAFWPDIGEPLKQVFGSSEDFLAAGANPDIFTWHYYPTQSNRCGVKTEGADWESLLDLETLQEFEKRNRIIRQWLKAYSPNSQQWLGETGPAQCGGKARLTDRFGASLWWLAHLGLAAEGGNQTVIRQSLVGGDYALLRYQGGYSPNPDFWASTLWQQNMGAKGFSVRHSKGKVQAFSHCHRYQNGVMSLVVINLAGVDAHIQLPQAASLKFIDVTSHELSSRYTFINGQLADVLDWHDPGKLPWHTQAQWRPLPAHSYRWVLVPSVHQCGDSSKASI